MANTINKYLIRCIWIPMLFLFGCSSLPDKRVDNTADCNRLEKRIDDLSGTINLIVNDGNRLHNDIQELKAYKDAVEQKMEKLTGHLRSLDECLAKIDTSIKTLEAASASAGKTGVEEIEQAASEGMPKAFHETSQTNEVKSDITLPKEEIAVANEGSAQTKIKDIQKSAEEKTQTVGEEPAVTPPKLETAVIGEISEQTKRELFIKGNITRLAEAEFPDNKGIQWNILGFEHKAHLTYAEAEPVSVTLAYPRFKFVVSFKNPEPPRVIGLFCFKDGQYSLWSAKK